MTSGTRIGTAEWESETPLRRRHATRVVGDPVALRDRVGRREKALGELLGCLGALLGRPSAEAPAIAARPRQVLPNRSRSRRQQRTWESVVVEVVGEEEHHH